MLRELPPPVWRPTPRTMADISLAARVWAGSAGLALVEPTLGISCALGSAGWLVRHALANSRLTRSSRHNWRRRAFDVLAEYTQLPRATGWGDPLDEYVWVYPENWRDAGPAQPPAPQAGLGAHVREWRKYKQRARLEGLRVVPSRVYLRTDPRARINWRLFRRHWNEVIAGFPGTPDRPLDPWRWTKQRGTDLIIGEPFSLPRFVPLPEAAWWNLDGIRLGILEDGTELVWDLLEIPHVLIGGSTRFGKTTILRLIAFQFILGAWQRGMQPGVVIIDPKGDEYVCFERDNYWNPSTFEGVHVATDTVDEEGNLTNLNNMAAAARAVRLELGRRRRASGIAARSGRELPFRPVVFIIDEAAELLEREPNPQANDDSDEANAIRARNAQRRDIERAIRTVARLGAKYRIHAVVAAQSPRAEFLPHDAKVNLAYAMFVGPGTHTELGIIFGQNLPDSPPARRGMGVWKDNREGVDPLDPYLYFKAYWIDPLMIVQRLDYALAA